MSEDIVRLNKDELLKCRVRVKIYDDGSSLNRPLKDVLTEGGFVLVDTRTPDQVQRELEDELAVAKAEIERLQFDLETLNGQLNDAYNAGKDRGRSDDAAIVRGMIGPERHGDLSLRMRNDALRDAAKAIEGAGDDS